MTREELIRILEFADVTQGIARDRTALAQIDPRWNIIRYCLQRHLEGKRATITSLASASGVPYGTAMRRIQELFDEGLLHKRPRSKTGKSFSLHPTRKLIAEFQSFAGLIKEHVGNTFGFSTEESGLSDFYFGGSYMAPKILSFPGAMRVGVGYERDFRILCPSDPTFKSLSHYSRNLNELCGGTLDFVNLTNDELHAELLHNRQREVSKYDIVSFDLPWIGELAEKDIVAPLNDIIQRERYNASDFHTAAWKGSRYNQTQYGIPIQPTAELLFYRTDLFAEVGLAPPASTNDVLHAAKRLHGSKPGLAGIVMNYGRGTPVAHTFVQTLAAFGRPIINLQPLGDDFDLDNIPAESFQPAIETDAGIAAATYLMSLLEVAHPDSLKCNWDRRIALFAGGGAAMSYGWSIRSAAFELDEAAPAHGKVDFLPHPCGPGARSVSPIGGFSLGIPSNLPAKRTGTAWKVIEYLTRPELMKWYVQNGNLTSPRFSTSADPEVRSFSKIIQRVDAMERAGQLQNWPRPPVPEFSEILEVLGEEIHDMLLGASTVENALGSAQQRVERILAGRRQARANPKKAPDRASAEAGLSMKENGRSERI